LKPSPPFRSCSPEAFALSSGAVEYDAKAAKGDIGGANARKLRQEQKRARLAASLRENLKRRKGQQRSRAGEHRPVDNEKEPRPPQGPKN